MRRFEMVEGTSSKFWEVSVEGSTLTTRWGRIGTDGQSKDKDFANATAAQKEHDKLVAEKTDKGYVEIGSAGGAAAPAKKTGPVPDEVKDIIELTKEASGTKEPMTRIYIMVRGKTKPAADDVNRAGGKTIGVDEASRPRYETDNAFMHHLWTIDLNDVPELKRFKSLAKARAVALFIHDAGDNECFDPAAGKAGTRILPISEADLAKGEWSGAAVEDPPGAALTLYPVDVPSKLFDSSVDFFEMEESEDEREVKMNELYRYVMSSNYLHGSPIYFQGDDHKGEFLGQFSEAIVDVNLGDAGTMYVFSDLAFWACH